MCLFCYISVMNVSKILQLAMYGAIIGYELPRMVHRLKSDGEVPSIAANKVSEQALVQLRPIVSIINR